MLLIVFIGVIVLIFLSPLIAMLLAIIGQVLKVAFSMWYILVPFFGIGIWLLTIV